MTKKLGRTDARPPADQVPSLAPLENRLGYRFQNPSLLTQALTPPSSGLTPNNQRLEYLGDAILQCCVSRIVFEAQPTWEEGPMSKLRGMLVCTESLRGWAQDLGLTLERGPRSLKKAPGNQPHKPMADAMEALLAAVYLDAEAWSGNPLDTVQEIVKKRFGSTIQSARQGMWEALDCKTTLQERASAAGLPAPAYELIQRTGPDHEPAFYVKVQVGSLQAEGTAGTLKRAQNEAARSLLSRLEEEKPN
jgi:ribonuclease-3